MPLTNDQKYKAAESINRDARWKEICACGLSDAEQSKRMCAEAEELRAIAKELMAS